MATHVHLHKQETGPESNVAGKALCMGRKCSQSCSCNNVTFRIRSLITSVVSWTQGPNPWNLICTGARHGCSLERPLLCHQGSPGRHPAAAGAAQHVGRQGHVDCRKSEQSRPTQGTFVSKITKFYLINTCLCTSGCYISWTFLPFFPFFPFFRERLTTGNM
jgi:hypothetical protein